MSSKSFRMFAKLVITFIAASLLTGCGGKKIENLAITCEQLRSELRPLENIQLLSRKLYYDGDSVAMLLGNETRQDNKRFIYETFPFMQSYTIESIQSGKYEKGINTVQIQAALHFFEKTSNPIVLSKDEIQKIESSIDDPYEEIVEPKVLRILGEPYSGEGCNGIDQEKDIDYSDRVGELFSDGLAAADDSIDHLLGILLCERDGKIGTAKCDTADFDSSKYSSSEFCKSQKLKITSNDNEPGVSCGTLRFSIFQADQNTGDCLALGYWNDRNGVQQVGAFFSCGLEEGMSYNAAVTVGNPYTYTNSYGAQKTVVSFSLN